MTDCQVLTEGWTEDEFRKYLSAAEDQVRGILLAAPSCHDWDHTQRVRRQAARLAALEGADCRLVDFAALLHDIGRVQELKDQGRTCHAMLGAEMVKSLLPSIGITDADFIARVSRCVLTHRFRARSSVRPESIEEKVLFDADKLDSLGAIGLGRSFHFAGRTGARVHNTREEALSSESYSLQDTAYREYLVKLRHLPERMLTESGRRTAAHRLRFMEEFFQELEDEINEKY